MRQSLIRNNKAEPYYASSRVNLYAHTQLHVKVSKFTASHLHEKIASGKDRSSELYFRGLRDETMRLVEQFQHLDKSVVGVYLDYSSINVNVLISLDAIDTITEDMRFASIYPTYYWSVLSQGMSAWRSRLLRHLLLGGILAYIVCDYRSYSASREAREKELRRIERAIFD